MRRFELKEGTASKFWEVAATEQNLTVRFGRIGTAGQTKTKTMSDAAAALKERDKLIKAKTDKGYTEVPVGDDATLPTVTASATKAQAAAVSAAPTMTAATSPVMADAGAQQTRAPKAAEATTNDIAWPTGGFQWRDEWRAALPTLRGINVPPMPWEPSFLPGQVRLEKDVYGHSTTFATQTLDELAQSTGHAWRLWGQADVDARITKEALAQANFEYWLELNAQLMCCYQRSNHMKSVAHTGITLHGITFIMDVVLELWEASCTTHRMSNERLLEQLRVLRHAIACADDEQYRAALESAERLRTRSDALNLACAHLFPHITPWAIECIDKKLDTHSHLLKDCALPVADWLRYLEYKQPYLYYFRSSALLQVFLHGEEAFEVLAFILHKADSRDATLEALELFCSMRVPQMISALVAGMENKEIRAALEKTAEQYPAAVLKTAMERALSNQSRTVEGWSIRLAMREPIALASAMNTLDPASRTRFEGLLAALSRDEASAEQLPELLRNPPWLQQLRTQELPTLDIEAHATPDHIDWSEQEFKLYANPKTNPWLLNHKPEHMPQENFVLEQLCVAEGMHARVLAGEQLRAEDIVKRQYHYRGGNIELLPLLPDKASLAVWSSYPAQLWQAWDQGPIRAMLARHGTRAIDGLAAYARTYPNDGLAFALQVDSAQLVPVALHALCNLKTAATPASQWIQAHPRSTATVALPAAFGKDRKERDNARFALRWMARNGFADLLREVAESYGDPVAHALHSLLNADPLHALPTRMPKLPTFFVAASFRRPEIPDGRVLPGAAVEHIGSMLAISELEAPYPGLEIVRDSCTAESLAEFAWDLFEAWLMAGAPSKQAWAFSALGLLGNDETARRLAPRVRAWPGESAHARAVKGLDVLAAIGSDVALMHLNGIAGKVKFKGLRDRAREKIAAVAEARGFTTEELADRLVPDLGLDETGSLKLDFGPRHFFVGFDETLKPFVKDAQGLPLKNLPKPGKSDDSERAKAATERFKQMKKDAKAVASLQVIRLELAMVAQRRWSAADFQLFFLEHPLMRHLAARLVWSVYVDGAFVQGFRVAEDWTLADENDALYKLPEDALVGIAHVLEMPGPQLRAFGQVFADYEILQPFRQLGRETYALTTSELAVSEITRYKDKVVATGSVMGLINRGWERGQAQDAGWVGEFVRPVGADLVVELQLEPGTIVGDISFEPEQTLPSITLRKSKTWDQSGLVAFSALDPILISEVLRDVELLTPAEAK